MDIKPHASKAKSGQQNACGKNVLEQPGVVPVNLGEDYSRPRERPVQRPEFYAFTLCDL
jgi:hypothetical protein